MEAKSVTTMGAQNFQGFGVVTNSDPGTLTTSPWHLGRWGAVFAAQRPSGALVAFFGMMQNSMGSMIILATPEQQGTVPQIPATPMATQFLPASRHTAKGAKFSAVSQVDILRGQLRRARVLIQPPCSRNNFTSARALSRSTRLAVRTLITSRHFAAVIVSESSARAFPQSPHDRANSPPRRNATSKARIAAH